MYCTNCATRAEWIFTNSGVADQAYCRRHLPPAYRNHPQLTAAPEEEIPDAAAFEIQEPAPAPKPKPRSRKRAAAQ